jgi:SPP1 family predicted phage head-tail adaptor
MQMQTPVTHKITMRYNASVTSATRLKFGTRIFAIKEVINVEERSRYLVVKAIEQS